MSVKEIVFQFFITTIALIALVLNQREVAEKAIGTLASSHVNEEGAPLLPDGIDMTNRSEIKSLLLRYSRRLQILKERLADQGRNTPPEVITEIEDIELVIKKLKMSLEK